MILVDLMLPRRKSPRFRRCEDEDDPNQPGFVDTSARLA